MCKGEQVQSGPAKAQFCSLKSNANDDGCESEQANVIVVAAFDGKGLSLFAHEELQQEISENDREYIWELLSDLLERANEAPDLVFDQLCHLSMGPIIVESVGEIEGSEESILQRFPNLRRLTIGSSAD